MRMKTKNANSKAGKSATTFFDEYGAYLRSYKQDILQLLIAWLCVTLIICIVAFAQNGAPISTLVKIVSATCTLFFLPGFILLRPLRLETFERIVLSLPISLAVNALGIYHWNSILNIKVTALSIYLWIVFISIACVIIVKYLERKKEEK
jgi:uncharacterized membrane protein